MFSRFLCSMFAVLCLFFFTLFSDDLLIGTTSGYAPYVSINHLGQYEGFDIDIAEELGKKLNQKVVIKDFGSMPSLFLALQQNKVDAIIWAISITEERLKHVEMVYYQGDRVTELPLVFWKEIPKNVQSIQDLLNQEKFTVAVEAGSFQESVMRSFSGLRIKNVDKIMDAILEIKYGKSIATLVDPGLMPNIKKQFPNIQVLKVELPVSQQSFGNGICMNKNNTLLKEKVSKAIDELRKEGKINELEIKWNLVGVENE